MNWSLVMESDDIIKGQRSVKNFNRLTLSTMSLLAILTSVSGLVFWWLRMPRRESALSKTVGAVGLLVACPGLGQSRNLHDDVKQLNFRHKTAHYALAGTVSDAKLKDFGLG